MLLENLSLHDWQFACLPFRNFCGISASAERLGLGNNTEIRLARLERTVKFRTAYAIHTIEQWNLEKSYILDGRDLLQGMLAIELPYSH